MMIPVISIITGCIEIIKSDEIIQFGNLVENAEQYHGLDVCTEGIYLDTGDMVIISESIETITLENLHEITKLKEPVIIIENEKVIKEIYEQSDEIKSPLKARACGIFEYGKEYGRNNNQPIIYRIR